MYEEESEQEDDSNDESSMNQKNRGGKRPKKTSISKGHKKAKKSTKSAPKPIKKSRAIIEDDDDDDDDLPITNNIVDMKSNLDQHHDDDEEEEEEEDDEEAVKEEFNDFIDDNPDDDDDDDDDASSKNSEIQSNKQEKKARKKKSKKKKKKKGKHHHQSSGTNSDSSSQNSGDDLEDELEDEDLDLIKNNLQLGDDDLGELGISTKKRRRIKIASESSNESGDDKKQKALKEKKKQQQQRAQQKKHRNDEEQVVDEAEMAEEEENDKNASYLQEDSNDEGSFIVDDTDDEAKNDNDRRSLNRNERGGGGGGSRNQMRKKRTYNDEAQQEALDIFGVNAEELGAVSDESGDNEDEYDEDFEEDMVEDDEEEGDAEDGEEVDDDDLTQKAAKKRQRQRRLKVMHKMEDIFEPEELEKNLLTELDQQIKLEDKPERFMLRSIPVTTEPNEFELEIEAQWIFSQVFQKKNISNQEPKEFTVIPKIKDALNFMRNEFFEVPFINSYRKEYVQPDLTINDLWKVYEYDEKYCQLKTRKENLLKLFERMKKYQTEEQLPQLNNKKYKKVYLNYTDEDMTEVEDESILNQLNSIRLIGENDLERILKIQTLDEFLDCYNHFHLHYSSELIPMKEFEFKETIIASKKTSINQLGVDDNNLAELLNDIDLDPDLLDSAKFAKFASRKDRLFHCKQAGLDRFASKFGLTIEQYGEILAQDYEIHTIAQCDIEPNQLALDFVKEPYFQSVEQVLNTVNYMMSIQLARDPIIRQIVRELYMQNSCITVRPIIPRGLKEIDESHPCFRFKYLKNKPCTDLKEDEFLKIIMAEQDGLITVKFNTLDITTFDAVPQTTQPDIEMSQPPPVSVVNTTSSNNNDDDWDDDAPAVQATPVVPPPAVITKTQTPSSVHSKNPFVKKSIIEKLKKFFIKDEFSYNVDQWNALRSQVIEDMCNKYLFPEFEKELRSKLLHEAKFYVFTQCQLKLRSFLEQAPFKPKASDNDQISKSGHLDYNDHGLNVLAITFTTSEMDESGGDCLGTVAVASFVNGAGDLDDYVRIRNFSHKFNQTISNAESKRGEFLTRERDEKYEDILKLEEFIIRKKPNVIVINSENKDALILVDDMKWILSRLKESEHQEEVRLGSLQIELVDNEVAKLFAASKNTELELGTNIPGLIKQGIGLARYVQDPLLCLTQLCNHDRDILGLKLHPMLPAALLQTGGGRQSDDASQLLRMLEIEFINRVNEVGVDLNRCNQCPHTAHSLQFVSGLGPRKAQHIIKVLRHQRAQLMSTLSQDKQIKTYPVATNRLFLVTKCTLGRRVFINCAGFIKFDVDSITKEIDEEEDQDKESSQQNEDETKYTEILDSTRIHPETYEWARKMAVDALDIEETTENEANANSALKEILENPKKLKDLDLDAFAAELIRTGHGLKNLTLYDIRKELMFRYKDERQSFMSMNDEDKFYALIKETPLTFHVGRLVQCRCIGIARRKPQKEQLDEANPVKDDNTCMWQCSFCKRNDFSELSQVWAHFDTSECPGPPVGVRTLLDNGCTGFIPLKFISDSHVTNPEDRIKPGMTIHARIVRIDLERFSVELTCKTSDLRDLNDKWKQPRDEYFDYRQQDEDQFKLDEKRRKEENKQTYVKRIIAHPQFKNVDYAQAVAHLKDMQIGDAIIRPSSKGNDHLTVTWKVDKLCFQHVDILEEKKLNAFSIGKRLIIEGEDFEDLDEILARHINPMSMRVREIMSHKNYKNVDVINAYCMNSASQSQINDTQQTIVSTAASRGDLIAKNEYIELMLRDEREKNKTRIPYMFSCCRNMPGKFMLSYMIKDKLRNEYIKIISDAFKFREKSFGSFNELINWFKLHFNDPLPIRAPPPPPPPAPIISQVSQTPNYYPARTPLQPSSINNNNDDTMMMPTYSASELFNENKKVDYSSNSDRGGGGFRGGYRGGGGGGGRGGGRGGGPNSENSRACFKCGETGHFSRECTSTNTTGSSRACYKCGEAGHFSRDCTTAGNGSYRGVGGGGGRGGGRGRGRGGYNNDQSKNNDWNTPRDTSYSRPSTNPTSNEDWDDAAPTTTSYSSNNLQQQPPSTTINRINDENWDDDQPAPPPSSSSSSNLRPSYSINTNKQTVVNRSSNADDDWDDDTPAQQPAVPKTPTQPYSNNNSNYNNRPPVQTEYRPTQPIQPVQTTRPSYNNNIPSTTNDENWDDDEPVQQQQKQQSNQNNNHSVNNYSITNKPPPQPPAKNNNNNNDDDWDDEPTNAVQMQISRPITPAISNNYSNVQPRINYNTSQSNPVQNKPMAPVQSNKDDDWDDAPVQQQQIKSIQPTRTTNQAYNNNRNNNYSQSRNNYQPTATTTVPTTVASRDDENWDDEPSQTIQPAQKNNIPPQINNNNNNNSNSQAKPNSSTNNKTNDDEDWD